MDYQKYKHYYRQYSPVVYGISLKLLGGEAAASEVLKSVFLHIAAQGWFSSAESVGKPHILQLTYRYINEKLGKPAPHPGACQGINRGILQAENN